MKAQKERDYIYASTRVRAAGGKGTADERLRSFTGAGSVDELTALIRDAGLVAEDLLPSATDLSSTVSAALDSAVRLVVSSVPDPSVYGFLLYKYDCNNLKVAVKENITGQYSGNLLFTCGTVAPEKIKECVRDRRFDGIPGNMAKRASEAYDEYEQTGEARIIDFLIDKGCFEDSAVSAKETGVALFGDLISKRADIVNVMTFLRVHLSGIPSGAIPSVIERASVSGGVIPVERFLTAAAEVAAGGDLREAVAKRIDDYPLRAAVTETDDLTETSARLEEIFESLVKPYEFGSFGPEIPAVFLIGREAELRQCRMIASMLRAGAAREDIRRRFKIS